MINVNKGTKETMSEKSHWANDTESIDVTKGI